VCACGCEDRCCEWGAGEEYAEGVSGRLDSTCIMYFTLS
jgi:hypothetical protein